jgi:hypothetical protein
MTHTFSIESSLATGMRFAWNNIGLSLLLWFILQIAPAIISSTLNLGMATILLQLLMFVIPMLLATKIGLGLYQGNSYSWQELGATLKKCLLPYTALNFVLIVCFIIFGQDIRNMIMIVVNNLSDYSVLFSKSMLMFLVTAILTDLTLSVFNFADIMLVDQEYSLMKTLITNWNMIKPIWGKMILFYLIQFILTFLSLGLLYPALLMARIDAYKKLKGNPLFGTLW